jgi:hypothetical protein
MGCLHTFLPSSCYYKKTVWCRGIHPLAFVTNPNSVSLQPKIVTCLDMQSHVCELQKKIKKIKLMVEWLMVHLKTQYFFVYSSLHLLSEHVVLPSFFSGVRVYQSFVVCVVFCWPVFVFFLFVCPLIYGVWLPHWYFLSCMYFCCCDCKLSVMILYMHRNIICSNMISFLRFANKRAIN